MPPAPQESQALSRNPFPASTSAERNSQIYPFPRLRRGFTLKVALLKKLTQLFLRRNRHSDETGRSLSAKRQVGPAKQGVPGKSPGTTSASGTQTIFGTDEGDLKPDLSAGRRFLLTTKWRRHKPSKSASAGTCSAMGGRSVLPFPPYTGLAA